MPGRVKTGGQSVGGGGGGAQINRGTYANLPASPTEDDLYYVTDLDVQLRYSGSAWQTFGTGLSGMEFFLDEGFVDSTWTVNKSGMTTLPTQDETYLPSAGTWAIRDSYGIFTVGAAPSLIAWDLGALKSDVFFMAGLHPGVAGNMSLFCMDTLIGANTEIQDAYEAKILNSDTRITKVIAGAFTTLAADVNKSPPDLTLNAYASMIALYYRDFTDTVRMFVKYGPTQWIEILNATNTDHTTMRIVGVRAGGSGGIYSVMSPFVVMTKA